MAVTLSKGNYSKTKPNKSDTPIYTIIFSLISIFLALYYVFKKIINQNEKNKVVLFIILVTTNLVLSNQT